MTRSNCKDLYFTLEPSSKPPPSAQPVVSAPGADIWEKIRTLKELLNQGFITAAEYEERKDQLVNQLTGTHTKSKSSRPVVSPIPIPTVVPRAPPSDFSSVKVEKAKLWLFEPRTGKWTAEEATVRMQDSPFARGALRLCYYCTVSSSSKSINWQGVHVAKLSIDPYEERQTYFTDIEIQMYSKMFAEWFNKYNPPKKVDFVQAYLLELIERDKSPLCGVEKFITGEYRKHNNNFGFVSDEERNTPQAFSHFTYESSAHKLLICDIQGVGDLYTDPQMHTDDNETEMSTRLQSKGNLGSQGIEKFKEVHQCNPICTYLKLPPINAKATIEGTVPAQRYMERRRVDIISVQNSNPLPPTARMSSTPVVQTPPPSPAVEERSPLVEQKREDESHCSCVLL